MRNWLRITFAIGPSALEDGFERSTGDQQLYASDLLMFKSVSHGALHEC